MRISSHGCCVSLTTEWIEKTEEYEKHDCELKAFARLARRREQDYPRLSICISADGLSPNQTFFSHLSRAWLVVDCDVQRWQRVLREEEQNPNEHVAISRFIGRHLNMKRLLCVEAQGVVT